MSDMFINTSSNIEIKIYYTLEITLLNIQFGVCK
jgi:hypothetical protein